VLACPVDDPLAGRKTITLHDLDGRNLIGFPDGWVIRALADRLMHDSGVHRELNLEVNDTATLLDLVEAGLGVALTAEALTSGRPRIRTVRLRGPQAVWTISAVAIAPEPSNPAARELWRLITRFPHRAAGNASARKPRLVTRGPSSLTSP
jgi:DNA-binding transcriptional LysR family regulator